MNTETITNRKEEIAPSKARLFMQKQWAMMKYAFSLEQALIHLVTAALLFGFAFFIKGSHEIAGSPSVYEVLLLLAAGIQVFRACTHSLTPVVILLVVGLGGQYLLHQHVDILLTKQYFQGMSKNTRTNLMKEI